MKLSDGTLEILKNFSTINSNLFISAGSNIVRTVSDSKNIFAEVEVEEVFPVNVGIMNLHKLLQTISMFEAPDFTFNENHLIIKDAGGRNSFKYYYTDPSCLTHPKKGVRDFPTSVSFNIDENMLGQITQASRVTSLPDVNINYDNNVVKLELKDRKNNTSNMFSFEIEAEGAAPLDVFMKVDNLKMMAGDYKMQVGERASRFSSLSESRSTLQYSISMDLTNV